MKARTTIEDVFSFIDDTHIKTIDTLELKSRIADMVQGEREKAINEFLHNAETKIYDRILQNQFRIDFASGLSVANRMLAEIAEQMKKVGVV